MSKTLRVLCAGLCLCLVTELQVLAAREGVATPILSSSAGEHAPSRSKRWLAWEKRRAARPDRGLIYAKRFGGGSFRVNEHNGRMGSVDGARLIYQDFHDGVSQIKIFNLKSRTRRTPPAINTRAWEYFPVLSGRWVMFARYRPAEGTRTLLLHNFSSNNTRVLFRGGADAYIKPGQINGRWAVYWVRRSGGAFKVVRLDLKTFNERTVPNEGRQNYAPAVTPRGTVYFGRSGRGCGGDARLLRWRPGRGTTRIKSFDRGVDFHGTFVYKTPQGKIHVLYSRIRCSNVEVSGDVFRYIDPFTKTLRVRKEGNGGGAVASRPGGIRCGRDCRQDFENGQRVTLVANPNQDSQVDGWSIDRCGTQRRCTVTMDQNRTVTVTFRRGGGGP